MKIYKADLHIHSCLSPCGDLDMSPRAIVEKSIEKGMDIIAVCDHNSAENVGAAMRWGSQKGLYVLPGIEVSSREEVHSLAIFESEEQALQMQELIYRHLRGTNRPEVFGDQVVANEFDEVEGFNDRLLIAATELGLEEIVRQVHTLGGVSIASHVDRESFSILGQLGFIPQHLELDALEISRNTGVDSARKAIKEAMEFTLVTFSDAHFLEDIGKAYTSFMLDAPTLGEIRMALKGENDRRVIN